MQTFHFYFIRDKIAKSSHDKYYVNNLVSVLFRNLQWETKFYTHD
jgi:hypothetical protein